MQTVSDVAKQLVDNHSKVILAVYIDGVKLNVGIGAGSYTGVCSGDDEFSFGNACAANCNISLAVSRPNLKGRRIQIAWTVDGTEYPLLTGQIDKAPITGGRTEIEAWDDMYFAGSNKFVITEAVATDCDAAAALSAVAAAMGVTADPDALTLLSGLVIPGGLSDLGSDATNATVAGYIAGLVGGNAVMTRDGLLTVKQYLATGWETEPYSGGASAETEDFSITGITLQREVLAAHTNEYGTSYEVLETLEYAAGDGSSVLANPLASQAAANRAYAALQAVFIRPGNYSFPGGLLLEPGDIFTVHSMDGSYAVAVGMISMDFDGGVKSLVSCGGGAEDVGATGPINQALNEQKHNYSQIKKILSVAVYYYLSTSSTALTGGRWSTTAPSWSSGKYMWSKTVTTYTDGSTSESTPACITGAAGVGVSSIITQFYLSTSNTTQTGGSWVTTMPTWSSGKYLWTRSQIAYTDGTVSYTAPVCDSAWEAVNELDAKLDFEEVLNRLTKNGELRGLFKEDGILVVNADCIRSLELLFAKDIVMTGKFECKAETYLPPTYDDCIYMLRSLFYPDEYPLPEEYNFDLNRDGVVNENDVFMAMAVYNGKRSMSSCPGAQKTTATLRINMRAPEKLIHIFGYNMWGSYVETYIGADANNCSFVSKDYLQRMINQDVSDSTIYRMVDDEMEYINPPMDERAIYRTTERMLGKAVYTVVMPGNYTTIPGYQTIRTSGKFTVDGKEWTQIWMIKG